MESVGNIRKMESILSEVVQYKLSLGDQKIDMNQLIGQELVMEFQGIINCIRCGRVTKKSFAQGFCYPCFTTAPETEECVLRPELCTAHEGVSRDMEYSERHCLIEHVVYISYTSGVKVGVSRNTQVPIRWIDQGAIRVIELARTPNRYTAGLLEVAMKAHVNDKTNWRKMLSGSDHGGVELVQEKSRLSQLVPDHLKSYVTKDEQVLELEYPVSRYPEKVRSLNFDKDPVIKGVLCGIKGQYLLFEDNHVINIRKFGGYLITLKTTS